MKLCTTYHDALVKFIDVPVDSYILCTYFTFARDPLGLLHLLPADIAELLFRDEHVRPDVGNGILELFFPFLKLKMCEIVL